jgi:FkbM family methyltransferase
MNTIGIFLKYARYRYMIHRISLRIRMGKDKRNEYLQNNSTSVLDFLPERSYRMEGGAKAIPRVGTSDFTVLFKSKEPKVESHLAMKENEIFVDVGANVGVYTLMVANNYKCKRITVIAIEAHPENYKALCRNIQCNHSIEYIIKPINIAVSDHKGIASMFERSCDGIRVGTSLYSLYDKFVYPNNCLKHNGRTLQIECDTLDNILVGYKADVMNMDIEAAEVLALKGATKTLKHLRKIVVECHGNNLDTVKELLRTNGFDIETIVESMVYVVGTRISSLREADDE